MDLSHQLVWFAGDNRAGGNHSSVSGFLQPSQRPANTGMFQQRYVKRHEIWHKPAYTQREVAFLRLPKSDCFQAANFGGLIPTESWSFSSEKSYSPNRLICCQDTTELFAMAWNRISRAFAAPRRCPALLRCGRMLWTILRI